jgi:molecular chaperone DnaJ
VPGDLLIRVIVEPKPGFERVGLDVLTEASVSLKDALLGVSKDIDTIHGKTTIKIPPCSKPGQKLSVKGKGAKSPKSAEFGRHILKVRVDFPTKLTNKQKKIIKESF